MPTLSVRARRRLIPRGMRRLLGPLSLLGAWQVATGTGLLDRQTLAPPAVVARTGWRLLASGDLGGHLWVSLHRVVAGLAIGVTVGVVLALLAGLTRLGEDVVDSTMQMLRTVPVLALVPLMILWFGIGEEPKIVLIAIGTAFPVYLNTFAAIRAVDGGLVEAAGTLGLRRPGLIRHVILPGALPGFLIGLRYSLGIAWLVLVVSEQINASQGLGFLMNEAREYFQTDVLVVVLVIYGLLGLISDFLVRLLERTFLSWRHNFSGT
jgi:sulfonate transport system permease protein